MKISRYTSLEENDNHYYIYNSLTNFFGEIDKGFYFFLKNKKNNNQTIYESELGDTDLWNNLINKRIITQNSEDDLLDFRNVVERQRRIHDMLLLTIAPTMECNFSCPYCFEHKGKGFMDDKTLKNILHFIDHYKDIRLVDITWFGGEPLLAPNIIYEISSHILKNKFLRLNGRIITNGYYLNRKNIELLKQCNISFVQVSLDGPPEIHNTKKYTNTDHNTFDRIIKNIDLFFDLNTDITLSIRVNLDQNNKRDFFKLYDFLYHRYNSYKNFLIMPAFIIETTKGNCKNSCLIEDDRDKLDFYAKEAMYTGRKDFIYPCNQIIECAVRNFYNSWVLDDKGYLYKCWEIIGNEDYKIGEIREDGHINVNNSTILNRYLYGADPFSDSKCLQCFSFPICKGGCPHKRIETIFNSKNYNFCTYMNKRLHDYLMIRTRLITTQNSAK